MKVEELNRKFQLIRRPQKRALEQQNFLDSPVQGQLFPVPKDHLIVFLEFPRISDEEFTTVLQWVKPSAVLELRRVPRFDVGQLNRKAAFRFFREAQATYFDLAANVTVEYFTPNDAIDLVDGFLKRSAERIEGPVVVLINQDGFDSAPEQERIADGIVKAFTTHFKHRWESVKVPQFA